MNVLTILPVKHYDYILLLGFKRFYLFKKSLIHLQDLFIFYDFHIFGILFTYSSISTLMGNYVIYVLHFAMLCHCSPESNLVKWRPPEEPTTYFKSS